jgi:hypothetical protein
VYLLYHVPAPARTSHLCLSSAAAAVSIEQCSSSYQDQDGLMLTRSILTKAGI